MAFLRIIFVSTLLMFASIDSTCGPPGIPVGADVYGHTSLADDGQTIRYICAESFKQVYGSVRRCTRGKWTQMPKCAIKQSSRLKVEAYKVNYLDIQDSVGYNLNRSFEFLEHILFNSSRRFTFQLNYSPKSRISYVEVDLQILSEDVPHLKVSLDINDYRHCVKSSDNFTKSNSVIELKFICEAKSDVDYEIEGKDLPKSLRFSFDSKNRFTSRVIRIAVFRFQNGCGFPDIPQNAKTIIDSGNTVSIYPSKPERYTIWNKDFDTINCLYEGNWNRQFEPLHPLITCPIDQFDWDSRIYKNVTFEYFEYFNDTLMATVDSKVQYQCNYSGDSSEYYYMYCQENGNWSTDDLNQCQQQDQNNELTNTTESNLFVIVITLLSTFVTTLILTLIFGSIIYWRRKKSKKMKLRNISVKCVKEFNNFMLSSEMSDSMTHGYEVIDYQEVNYQTVDSNRNQNDHTYMQIFD